MEINNIECKKEYKLDITLSVDEIKLIQRGLHYLESTGVIEQDVEEKEFATAREIRGKFFKILEKGG